MQYRTQQSHLNGHSSRGSLHRSGVPLSPPLSIGLPIDVPSTAAPGQIRVCDTNQYGDRGCRLSEAQTLARSDTTLTPTHTNTHTHATIPLGDAIRYGRLTTDSGDSVCYIWGMSECSPAGVSGVTVPGMKDALVIFGFSEPVSRVTATPELGSKVGIRGGGGLAELRKLHVAQRCVRD